MNPETEKNIREALEQFGGGRIFVACTRQGKHFRWWAEYEDVDGIPVAESGFHEDASAALNAMLKDLLGELG